MSPLVGVVSALFLSSSEAKRFLLLFDRVITPSPMVPVDGREEISRALDLLERAGAISYVDDPAQLGNGSPFERTYLAAKTPTERIAVVDFQSRVLSDALHTKGVETVPVLYRSVLPPVPADASSKAEVLRVILNAFPLPSSETPFSAILDWRSDEEALRKYRRLRAWISRASQPTSTAAQISEELATLLDDYELYMRSQHTKLARGRIEIIVTTAAEVLENVATLKLSTAVSRLFGLLKEDATLLQSELSAPGREVAYVAHARAHLRE